MARIFVDNQPHEVKDGQNLLEACLSLGYNLPYFCWHPAMGSVGACRQCAVKQFRDEGDKQGRIVMACMTPATDGIRISIDDPDAKAFRASIAELLMVNHPHDCPICDEGGECHLQDMIVMTGHDYRRYRGKKRTYRNQNLGPFINHEMNRCIQCYRCVRFYRDYAGGHDLNAFALRKDVFFGRYEEGPFESEFSGNLVEVCPTGVFTDKTLKQHFTRQWDLQTAPSVCVNCSVGCNTIPGERYGMLRRVRNRYNGEVNGYFLCDRGRYGYEFVNSSERVREPLARQAAGQPLQPVGRDDALKHVASLLSGNTKVIGIGSPRASLEANFALRSLVGPDHFYLGLSERDAGLLSTALNILRNGPARSPSLHDAAQADAVLVLGEDVTNTAPMLALALRQSVRQKPMEIAEKLQIPAWDDAAVREAVQQEKGPLYVAAPYGTRLDEVATRTHRAAPDDLARLGFAVAQALGAGAPAASLPDDLRSLAEDIARALKEAERPLIVSGTGCASRAVIEAAANVAWALCQGGRAAELCLVVPECNSLGIGLMGGGTLEAALEAVRAGAADTIVVLENDLYRRADAAVVEELLGSASHVIAIDHLGNTTTSKAEAVLPAATFAEGDGTFVNSEGRAQRFFQVFVPEGEIQESWRWLRDVMVSIGRAEPAQWQDLDDVVAALSAAMPVFGPVTEIAPLSTFRIAGQKIARQAPRYSGRTAMLANVNVSEPKPPDDPDSALAFSMEGYDGQPPGALIARYWAPGWNSVQALNKFQSEVGGPLRGGDPGRRLIEPAPVKQATYFREAPPPFQAGDDRWLMVPIHHIFGSEELSVLSPGVAELAPEPYIGLNPADADRLHVREGDEVVLPLGGTAGQLPVKIMATLPRGIAGLPASLPGLPGFVPPTWTPLFATPRDS